MRAVDDPVQEQHMCDVSLAIPFAVNDDIAGKARPSRREYSSPGLLTPDAPRTNMQVLMDALASPHCQGPRLLCLFITCLLYTVFCTAYCPTCLLPMFIFTAFTCFNVPGMRLMFFIVLAAMLFTMPRLRSGLWDAGSRSMPSVQLRWPEQPPPG